MRIDGNLKATTCDIGNRIDQIIEVDPDRHRWRREAVVAHWVEYSKGLLLFVMVPGDERSGEFYIYDRRKGSFWLLSLADCVFGGYALADMKQKIKDFRLLEFAEDPSRLPAAKG